MSPPPCQGVRVLLVDDDEAFRTALAANLEDDGHEVLSYESPEHVPPLVGLDSVGIVITDFAMPARNGLVFADACHEELPAVPVLMVTAHWSHHLAGEVGRRGFLQLRQKPIGYDEIHTLVHTLGIGGG